MRAWKVILATLVIYVAGLVTGVLVVKTQHPVVPRAPAETAEIMSVLLAQKQLMERMKRELHLTPAQIKKIETAFTESRERMKSVWLILEPEVQTEVHEVREHIRAQLNAEQREKFEKLLKERRRFDFPRPADGRKRPRDNPASTNAPRGRPANQAPASPPL